MQIRPSKEFVAYAQASVQQDAQRPYKDPSDVFERKLWSAAGFDWYLQAGQFVHLVDDGGLPKVEACAYKSLIDVAQKIKTSDGVSNVSWDEHFKRYPVDAK
jgi:hypothetical protein